MIINIALFIITFVYLIFTIVIICLKKTPTIIRILSSFSLGLILAGAYFCRQFSGDKISVSIVYALAGFLCVILFFQVVKGWRVESRTVRIYAMYSLLVAFSILILIGFSWKEDFLQKTEVEPFLRLNTLPNPPSHKQE